MSIGRRIKYNNKHGTIKFVGEVSPVVGLKYGIDWDSPDAGKHDGTYKGVRYFQAKYPKSGSFVSAKDIDFGYKFTDAVKEQYDYDLAKIQKDTEEKRKEFMDAIPVPVYEFPNIDKIKRLYGPVETMKVIDLSSFNVGDPGEYGEIEAVCPNIVDLDLSNNLMNSWEQVAVIGRQLKKLESLTLSNSRLTIPDEPEKLKDAFVNLKQLYLCRNEYTWQDILKCSLMVPQLETLKVPYNLIYTLESTSTALQNLRELDLQCNMIGEWSEICKLGHLPNLEFLNASNTGISEIILSSDDALFGKLHTLYITQNNIKSWENVSGLSKLPVLSDLRITKNPITAEDTALYYREKLIGRIENLKVLNGHEVTNEERRFSEYTYLKELSKKWVRCINDEKEKAKFLYENPRYPALIEKYGVFDVPTEMDTTLNRYFVNLTLIYTSKGITKQTINKRMSLLMTIQKVAFFAQRIFKCGDVTSVVRVSGVNPMIKVEMTNEDKPLDYYSVEDGDSVYVSDD